MLAKRLARFRGKFSLRQPRHTSAPRKFVLSTVAQASRVPSPRSVVNLHLRFGSGRSGCRGVPIDRAGIYIDEPFFARASPEGDNKLESPNDPSSPSRWPPPRDLMLRQKYPTFVAPSTLTSRYQNRLSTCSRYPVPLATAERLFRAIRRLESGAKAARNWVRDFPEISRAPLVPSANLAC